MSLPKWIKDLNSIMWPGVFPNLERTLEALAIAWKALECVNAFSNDPQLIKENKDAMRRINELGTSSNGPKKTNNLTYEDTV